jgi:NTP pyrophosphatase (non-canonical NTP hydrolase)
MQTFLELENKVLTWADEKGIVVENPTQAVIQAKKMMEEVQELQSALELVAFTDKDKLNPDLFDAAFYASELELGDVLVTVIITAACMGVDPIQSLGKAYDKISKRKGKTIAGIFVKDE